MKKRLTYFAPIIPIIGMIILITYIYFPFGGNIDGTGLDSNYAASDSSSHITEFTPKVITPGANKWNTFRGIRLGDDISNYPDMILYSVDTDDPGGASYYSANAEYSGLGSATVNNITCLVYDNHIVEVSVTLSANNHQVQTELGSVGKVVL